MTYNFIESKSEFCNGTPRSWYSFGNICVFIISHGLSRIELDFHESAQVWTIESKTSK